MALAAAAPAQAAPPDLGLSASVASDYRYRGLSLSDGLPALSVSISYDHPAGPYLSATVIGGPTSDGGPRLLGYQAYVGYARRLGDAVSVDAGLADTEVTVFARQRYRARYAEAYLGAAFEQVSVRVYYSPDYFGEDISTVYADASAWLAPAADWRLVGHVGLLAPLHRGAGSEVAGALRYDARVGLARLWPGWRAELAWNGHGHGADYYPQGIQQAGNAVVFTATRYF
ncbi:MAG TPA: TorF family putative porin [Caulobacteraceae bacterium]|nr:TorF family putative porin [Caulobacteraceae bacterium]